MALFIITQGHDINMAKMVNANSRKSLRKKRLGQKKLAMASLLFLSCLPSNNDFCSHQ